MRVLGLALVVLGSLALGYGGFTYVTKEKVVDPGPVEVPRERDRERRFWVPPTVGGIVIVTGLILLAIATRKQ